MKRKYYFDMVHVVQDMRRKTNECFICGSQTDLEPHHIRKVSKYNPDYCDKDNLVILCHDCHLKYHNRFGDASPKNFIRFVLDQQESIRCLTQSVNDLKREQKRLRDENHALRLENKELEGVET